MSSSSLVTTLFAAGILAALGCSPFDSRPEPPTKPDPLKVWHDDFSMCARACKKNGGVQSMEVPRNAFRISTAAEGRCRCRDRASFSFADVRRMECLRNQE